MHWDPREWDAETGAVRLAVSEWEIRAGDIRAFGAFNHSYRLLLEKKYETK